MNLDEAVEDWHRGQGGGGATVSESVGYYKALPCRHGPGWICWAGLVKLTGDSAVSEPSDPIHFTVGAREAETITAVLDEMTAEYGQRKWYRQEAGE